MATREKDTTPGIVKEKRRISSSPSFPRPTNNRKSINTTTTTTIAPNYIKPTKPTNVDPLLKSVNTKASSSTLSKPSLARRRSFDNKPLSQPKKTAPAANADSSTPKSTSTVVRPKPRTERLRSSSSLKAPASPTSKSKVATTARKPVPVKSSRPATTAVYKKKQPQSNAAAKNLKSKSTSAAPPKSDIDQNDARKSDHEVETESCQDNHDQESICSSVVDANNENDNSETASDMVHDDQLEQTDEEVHYLAESSTAVSEVEDEKQSEAESENKVIEETEKLHQDNTNNDESKRNADNDDDANLKKDGLESEEEKATNNEANEKISVAAAEEEKEALDDNKEKLADKEKVVEEVSGDDQQVKSESDDTKKKINNNSTGRSYKKESSVAYNDVIEETATKLKNQRKNKVLALVGAFETVMSLQD